MSDEALPVVGESPVREHEVVTTSATKHVSRTATARKAFAEAVVASKPTPAEPVAPPEPDEPAPAWMDPEVARLRRELAADRESLHRTPSGASLDDLLDRPGPTTRAWLESVHGEKFANEHDFKTATADLVTRLSSEVLGVPLPSSVRVKLDSAAAQKAVKSMRSAAAKRETERAEREAHDSEWAKATAAIDRKLATGDAAKTYPHLAAEPDRGQLVIDVVRAAADAGEQITWEAAAKLAEAHLKRSKPAPAPKPAPSPAPRRDEPAKPTPKPLAANGKWNKDAHRAQTLAKLRAAAGKA